MVGRSHFSSPVSCRWLVLAAVPRPTKRRGLVRQRTVSPSCRGAIRSNHIPSLHPIDVSDVSWGVESLAVCTGAGSLRTVLRQRAITGPLIGWMDGVASDPVTRIDARPTGGVAWRGPGSHRQHDYTLPLCRVGA